MLNSFCSIAMAGSDAISATLSRPSQFLLELPVPSPLLVAVSDDSSRAPRRACLTGAVSTRLGLTRRLAGGGFAFGRPRFFFLETAGATLLEDSEDP